MYVNRVDCKTQRQVTQAGFSFSDLCQYVKIHFIFEWANMTDWTSGYVADIGYTFGYYRELSPLRVALAFLNSGLAYPKVGTACELGFGQGLSANLHAAASVTSWHGTDFNPSQASFAQELAEASGAAAQLYDEAFNDFAKRDDLPDFDFIGLHGIWSWISDDNRHVIVEFIRRKLKVGGVLYISYNTLPGWAAFAPMRHLMTEHAHIVGSKGRGILSKIDGALEFTEKLLATNPGYARANPQIGERLNSVKAQNRHYLAHEYFNRDWHPMHFATMAQWLEPAKLTFACSAHYPDYVDVINVSTEQQQFLDEIPDMMLRESTRDFMVNQQFRRDYWIKGGRRLDKLEQGEALRAHRVILTTHRSEVSLKVGGNLGEADMSAAIYNPILDVMADHKIRSIGEIEQALQGQDTSFAQLMQAVLILSGTGQLSSVQDAAVIAASRVQVKRINAYLCTKARGSPDINYLASPVTGGGVLLTRFQQLFILAIERGMNHPVEWAGFVGNLLASQMQKIIKEGKPFETDQENVVELIQQAEVFAAKQLPVLKALEVV